MAEQTEPKFVIQGVDYPVPAWETFTLDESEIMFDRGRITLDQVDEDMKMTPGLLSALVIVAYMRGNPTASRARAEKIVGAMKLADVVEHLADVEDDADVPPSASEMPDSPENTSDSTTTSGTDSGSGSVNQDEPPLPTGTLASVMQLTSDQRI